MTDTDLNSPPNNKPPRKFPPPCWQQNETLALIAAYRDKWYSLRRGYLRSADWEAVAAAIPDKTSAQCRHKIEKLRQKYRAEKQRRINLAYTQFPSSWFFYDAMDSMENGGSSSNVGLNQGDQGNQASNFNSNVLRIESVRDRSLVDSVTVSNNLVAGVYPNSVNLGSRGNFGDDFGSGVGFRIPFEEKVTTRVVKAENLGKAHDYRNGFNVDVPPGFMVKAKMNVNSDFIHTDVDPRGKGADRCEMNTNVSRSGVKRGREDIDEMVYSIKLLGEGFVRMEKMKMDMAWEMEKTRMEMELKRDEMILESQRHIVNAFLSAFLENKSNNEK